MVVKINSFFDGSRINLLIFIATLNILSTTWGRVKAFYHVEYDYNVYSCLLQSRIQYSLGINSHFDGKLYILIRRWRYIYNGSDVLYFM